MSLPVSRPPLHVAGPERPTCCGAQTSLMMRSVCVCLAYVQPVYMFALCLAMFAALFPSITHTRAYNLPEKLPSSSIMDQGMFLLPVLDHLSKQASNSLAMSWQLSQQEETGTPVTRTGSSSRAKLLKY